MNIRHCSSKLRPIISHEYQLILYLFRGTSVDIKYQIWKFGVVFTDGVSKPIFNCVLHTIIYYTTPYHTILYYISCYVTMTLPL